MTNTNNREDDMPYKLLHAGCGYKNIKNLPVLFQKGWQEVRLDLDPNTSPDITGSVTNLNLFDTNSIDAVYSAHNIEHLYSHEVLPTLKEFLRVLKPTGFTIITLPDLQRVAELIADDKLMDVAYQSGMGPISAIDMVFGHRGEIANGNKLMSHRTGFTRLSLTQVLKQAGFNEVRVMRGSHFDLWAIATVTHHDKGFWELMDKTIIVK